MLSKTYIRYNFNREFLFHALVGSATSENKRKHVIVGQVPNPKYVNNKHLASIFKE